MANTNPIEGAQEIQQMLVTYAKQETVEPLKTLGRYLAFGIAGSLMISLGVFFVGLATLRLMQRFEVFGGSAWASTLPYLGSIGVLLAAIALIYLSLTRAKKKVLS